MNPIPQFDIDILDDLVDELGDADYTLSPRTVQLCLSCLKYAEVRDFWVASKSSPPLTDSRWDDILAVVDLAYHQLLVVPE